MRTGCKLKEYRIGKGHVTKNSDGSRSVRITAVFSKKDMDRLRKHAIQSGTNISDMIRHYVRRGMKKDEDSEIIPDDFLDT